MVVLPGTRSWFDVWLVTLSICKNPWWVSFCYSDRSFSLAANIWINDHGDTFNLFDLFLASRCHYLYDPSRNISSHLTKAIINNGLMLDYSAVFRVTFSEISRNRNVIRFAYLNWFRGFYCLKLRSHNLHIHSLLLIVTHSSSLKMILSNMCT